MARHSVLKQLYADLPEITAAPLLPSLAAVLLVYFEKNHVYYLLYNWLQANAAHIATSEHQITSDDMTMRDLGLIFWIENFFNFLKIIFKIKYFLSTSTNKSDAAEDVPDPDDDLDPVASMAARGEHANVD